MKKGLNKPLFLFRFCSDKRLKILVTLQGNEPGFPDGLLNAHSIEGMVCSRYGNNIFFDHDASEIVGACVKTQLGCRLSDGQPGGLDVWNVGQHDPADGDHADIRFGGHPVLNTQLVAQYGILILKRPGDKIEKSFAS